MIFQQGTHKQFNLKNYIFTFKKLKRKILMKPNEFNEEIDLAGEHI